MSVDVILLKPGSQKQIYGELSTQELTAIEPPLWAALLGGYLRSEGFSVLIMDAEVEDWSYEESARRVAAAKPKLLVITVSGSNPLASTMNMSGAGEIAKQVKAISPRVRVMMSGLHPSALPKRTMLEEKVNYVCEGEGFHTIEGLLKKHKCRDIEGLWYRRGCMLMSNERAPLEDVSSLPNPAWDLLPMKSYRAHTWHCFDNLSNRQPYALLYTSLGCPFKCSFCAINTLFGRPTIRYRPIKNILEDLDYFANLGIRNVKIVDEMFGLSPRRVIELCDAIVSRGYEFNMWAYAKANTVNPAMLSEMKSAGINWLCYGFESGSGEVLSHVRKRQTVEEIWEAVRMTKDAGIHIVANFIFGLPGDDMATMQDTYEMSTDINAEWANFYCAMAYPGSEMYKEALLNNIPLPKRWIDYSQYSYDSMPFSSARLTPAEILDFRDTAFKSYYSRPEYHYMIEDKFNVNTRIHVEQLALKDKLKRRSTDLIIQSV